MGFRYSAAKPVGGIASGHEAQGRFSVHCLAAIHLGAGDEPARPVRHEWVWIKNRGGNFLNSKREPMKEHETVLVFSRGGWTYNRQMQERTGGGASLVGRVIPRGAPCGNWGRYARQRKVLPELRVPSSWQKFNKEGGLHPTQKPVALGEYLIRTYTNPGDTVLDPAIGSGSFGVAAVNTGRAFVGIERDAGYFATAKVRIEGASQPAPQPSLFGALAAE